MWITDKREALFQSPLTCNLYFRRGFDAYSPHFFGIQGFFLAKTAIGSTLVDFGFGRCVGGIMKEKWDEKKSVCSENKLSQQDVILTLWREWETERKWIIKSCKLIKPDPMFHVPIVSHRSRCRFWRENMAIKLIQHDGYIAVSLTYSLLNHPLMLRALERSSLSCPSYGDATVISDKICKYELMASRKRKQK